MIILAGDQSQDQQAFRPAPPRSTLGWSLHAPWLDKTVYLTDLTSPVLKLRGAMGTGQVVPTHRWSATPTLDGDSWEGLHVGRGEGFTLPLIVRADSELDFLSAHDEFMRMLDPRREVYLRITRPDGTWRQQAGRYESGADAPINLDPVALGRASYVITWATADPYWRGEPIPTTFVYADDTPAPDWFEDPAPIDFAPANSLDGATVKNPGDVDSPATWRITGPFSGFRVGVGAAVVELDYARSAGEWVDIDMSTQARTILDQDGNDLWDFAGDVEMADIPAGDVALTVSIDSPGEGTSATLTFVPGYRRAW